MDARGITDALGGKWNVETGEGSAKCPAHEDRHPSLSVSDGRDGRLLAHCHKGCEFGAIREALERQGLWDDATWPSLAPRGARYRNGTVVAEPVAAQATGARQIEATYDYCDENGVMLYQAVRYTPKDFRQRQPAADGGWVWSITKPPVRLVPYRLPELLAAASHRHVFVVEGEKDVERLRALGLLATTNPLGATKWRDDYAEPLRGRPVVVIPDNDPKGEEHAALVVNSLLPVAASVKLVRLPNLPEKGDVSDWLSAGGSRGALEQLVRATAPVTAPDRRVYPVQSLGALLRLTESQPSQIVEGILWAERVHWAFAAPGAGKTLFLLAAGMHVAAGRPFCGRAVRQMPVLLIEEDSPFSVLAEYVDLLSAIYEFDLDNLPFWTNQEQGLRLSDPAGPEMLYSAIEQCPERPGLVLLDACERLVPSDKFSSKELDCLTRCLQRLITDHLTPGVIDHTRRPSKDQKGGPVDYMELLYGGRSKSAIADVMMHFGGSPRSQMRVTYAKFRGEPPLPLDLTFGPDTGFVLKAQPRAPRTQTEQKVLSWFGECGDTWQDFAVIQAATEARERSLYRALDALVARHWLEKEGTKKQGTRYRSTPGLPGVFV